MLYGLGMPSREYRTHCKKCGGKIAGTQHVTCVSCRKPMAKRELATCPCGKPAENIRSKYCGKACRDKHGVRPPAKTVTKVCLGCGNEFTRPHYYPGKLKYCSNACSHKQVKSVRDKFIADLPEGAVVFHSGWEIRFWAACLRWGIPIRSYDGPDIETSVGAYRPDFIAGGRIVEVKGYLRPESEIKISEARAQGVEVVVIGLEQLDALESLGLLEILRKA